MKYKEFWIYNTFVDDGTPSPAFSTEKPTQWEMEKFKPIRVIDYQAFQEMKEKRNIERDKVRQIGNICYPQQESEDEIANQPRQYNWPDWRIE